MVVVSVAGNFTVNLLVEDSSIEDLIVEELPFRDAKKVVTEVRLEVIELIMQQHEGMH